VLIGDIGLKIMTFAFSNLAAQRTFGGKLIVALTWLMAAVVIIARLAVNEPFVSGAIACVAIATAATIAWRIAGRGSTGRSLTGVALMAQVSMLVASMSGHAWQIDMHMAYFSALALLVIYCDWPVIAAAAATVAVHHLGLNFLLPMAVFPGGGNLGRVVVHAVILIVESVTLMGATMSVSTMFEVADNARRKAEDAVAVAQAAHEAAENAKRSEELRRAQFSEAEAKLERQRADTVSILARELARLADGDLTARIEANFEGDYAQIKLDFNSAAESLQAAMMGIGVAGAAIRNNADEIAGASDDLCRRTERQAASLEQTAAALDEITVTVKQGADGARQASSVASSTHTDAERVGSLVRDAVVAMSEIEQSAGQIAQIIGLIDEIAFQTSLLALNAGVEAARAGESGRGFAVVAQEVRALAQRSADAAKQIKALIATSTSQVQRGVNLVGDTGAALDGIVVKVAEIDKIIAAIASSSQEQANGLVQVNIAVNQMDQVTQQNAAMVEQSTAATTSLRAEAADLDRRISKFRTGRGGAATGQPERAQPGRHAVRDNSVSRMQARLSAAVGRAS
jgi:methyl-accepting chemotaxis protein